MGQNIILNEALVNQIFSFLAYLFPFLASVAFSLFLRKMDRYNNLINQIHLQKQELKNTEAELADVRSDLNDLVESFNFKLEDKMEDVVLSFQKKCNALNSNLDEQTQKIDKSLNFIYETSKDKLGRETDHLIQLSVEKVNSLSGKLDSFQKLMNDKQAYIDEKYNSIKDITGSSLNKFEKFDQVLSEKIEDSVEGVEEKVNSYSKKFMERLDFLRGEATKSIHELSDELKAELSTIKEETESTHRKVLEHESDLLKNLDSKRSKLFEEFNELTKIAERNLEAKLFKVKDSTDIVSEKINTLDMRMEEKLESINRLLTERVGQIEKKFQERYDSIQEQAIQTKDSFLKGLKAELDMVRTNLDNLKIDSVNKRDDLLNETRNKIKDIELTVNRFIEKYLDDENKILKQTDQKKNELQKELREIEEHLATQKEKFKEDMEKSLEGIKAKVNTLGEDTFFKMKAVDEHFENLKTAMNESARDVVEQVELDVAGITEKVDKSLIKIDSRLDGYVKNWNDELGKIRDYCKAELDGIESKIQGIHIDGDDILETLKLEHIQAKIELEALYHKYNDVLNDKRDILTQDILNRVKSAQDDLEVLINKLHKSGVQEYEKQETMLVEFGEKLVKSIESKLEKARYQSEDVIDSISKAGNNLLEKQEEKIDKFNSTLDDRISRQLTLLIDRGQLQLDALESRIASYVQDVKSNIESNLKSAREDSDRQIEVFNNQFLKSFKEIENANNQFLDSSRKEFVRTKEEFVAMKTGIESEINRVNELKNNLYTFLSEEGTKLKSQKVKSEEIGENILRANKALDVLNKKTDEMKEKILLLNSVDEKIKKLMEIQKDFEIKAETIFDVNERIRSVTESLLILESNEADVSYKLQEILGELSSFQKREKELQESIQSIELKTAFLQGRDMDVKSIEAKFDKVENLMMDLSARHKQIATMQNRIETLRNEVETMKDSLEGLLDEADNRFEKLSDFLSVVDTVTSPYSTKTGKNQSNPTNSKADNEIIKKKKATVLQLHDNFDWDADRIASKLNLEKSLVETIINSKK